MGGRIDVEKDGAIGWIVFDHPERRNAISVEMWRALPAAAKALGADDAIRVVVMRGAGDAAFVSGADISEFEAARTGAATAGYERANAEAFLALARLEKPVIAMIRGSCVGGGVAVSLTADLRYAADDAVFAIPAARLGVGYQMPGLEALARVVGLAAAKEIFFTARRFTAGEAARMGLVNRVVPAAELEGFVRETAAAIAGQAPLALRSAKRAVAELARQR